MRSRITFLEVRGRDSDLEDVQDKSYQIIRQLTIEEERLVKRSE